MNDNFISIQYSKVLHLSARIALTVDSTVVFDGNTSRVVNYMLCICSNMLCNLGMRFDISMHM